MGDGHDLAPFDMCLSCEGEGVILFEESTAIKAEAAFAAREVLRNLESWQAEAGQQAQIHQLPEAEDFCMVARIQGVIEDAINAYRVAMRQVER